MIKIVGINSKYVHTLLAPYYLKENCDYKNIIEISQFNINDNLDNLHKKCLEGSPKVLAFSCYIFNINCVLQLVKKIRKTNPEVIIVFGGPEVSFEYQNILEFCDYLILGEGETAFNELVCDLVKSDFKICGEQVRIGKDMPLDNIKSPYSDDYFRDTEGKIAYFEASRGCPFNCAYCMSGNCGLRCFDLQKTMHELEKFKGKNIRVLKFVDRTFNAKKDFALQIMQYLIDNSKYFGFSFHFEIASDIIDDEFIDMVAKSPKGLFQFEVGVQSFNEDTLKSVIRNTNTQKVMSNLQKLIATNKSHIHTDLIAGLPFEGYESFANGFNKLYQIKSQMLQLGFLKVLKGSRLKSMLDEGYVYDNNPPYEIIKTPYLSKEDILNLKYVEDACDKYYNSQIFSNTLNAFVGDNPFEFYLKLGKRIYGKKLSLFDRIDILFDFLIEENDCDIVKSLLTYDYLSNNNSKILPQRLKFEYNKNFAKQLKQLNIDKKTVYTVLVNANPLTFEKGQYLLCVDYSYGYNVQIKEFKNEN